MVPEIDSQFCEHDAETVKLPLLAADVLSMIPGCSGRMFGVVLNVRLLFTLAT
jgi:hypothetical protein